MTPTVFDITAFFGMHEGQHFDRKSLFEGPDGQKRQRDRKAVRDHVAEYVAAFANAEGGVLILGIENDGSQTGHRYPADVVAEILRTPASRLAPVQAQGFKIVREGVEFLVFDVAASDGPVQVVGDGFPLRIGDTVVQVSESKILALKLHGLAESWEARASSLKVADLDAKFLAQAKAGSGLSGLDDPAYLLKRKLPDRRGRELVLRRGAELVFAQDGADHPNAGVRIFRVIGSERRTGPEHNVEERPRIEGALPAVLNQTFQTIDGLIRRPSRLVGNRFRPTPEYPEFSWKEAILNAIAHRDYESQGRGVEVWLFDDRLEVVSPGGLMPDAPLEELLALRRVHASRNPRTVRALVDLGFMRDQGEGIPRMFAEMEGQFLPAPTIEVGPRDFRITLRNTPTLTAKDREFVASLGSEELTDQEFRALLEASRQGRIENAHIRAITGLDTLSASRLLRRLRDRGLLTLHAEGANSYYELASQAAALESQAVLATPDGGVPIADDGNTQELAPASGQMPLPLPLLSRNAQELPTNAQELDADTQELDAHTQELLAKLGPRPRKAKVRELILRVCSTEPRTAGAVAALLGMKDAAWLTRTHLTPMVRSGALEWTQPATPTHPAQAYRMRTGGATGDKSEAAP